MQAQRATVRFFLPGALKVEVHSPDHEGAEDVLDLDALVERLADDAEVRGVHHHPSLLLLRQVLL